MTMPAGTYYVGDLCYVMQDVWNEVCDLMHTENLNQIKYGEHTLKDGRRFAVYATAYGDGVYAFSVGDKMNAGVLGVDAGVIGCIKIDDVNLDWNRTCNPNENNDTSLGYVHKFAKDFETGYVCDEIGEITFGDVTVHTADLN